jgi:hypothetical protein
VPSGRQNLNLRPLDPQGRRKPAPELRQQQICRSSRGSCSMFISVQRSSRPISAPDPLQRRSLQHATRPDVRIVPSTRGPCGLQHSSVPRIHSVRTPGDGLRPSVSALTMSRCFPPLHRSGTGPLFGTRGAHPHRDDTGHPGGGCGELRRPGAQRARPLGDVDVGRAMRCHPGFADEGHSPMLLRPQWH